MAMTAAQGPAVGFAGRLASFGRRLAILGPHPLTYAELADRVEIAREAYGPVRRLVLIEAVNTLEVLVPYLAALAGGHPVLLAPGCSSQGVARLTERYDPDVVIGADGALHERRAGSAHQLHPELALLLSTSGSAGSPKTVRLSAANLEANADSIALSLGIDADDRAITSLPMSYCYGLSVIHSHLARGAGLVLTSDSVTDPAFWAQVDRHRVSTLAGVPYTFDLLEQARFDPAAHPSLRLITQAGGRLAEHRVRHWAELGRDHGFAFVVMYGQTEATARMACLPASLAPRFPGSVGRAVPGGRLRIDGAGPDGVGEVVYEGPNVMLGYAAGPQDLALGRAVTELRTGDRGRIGPAGLLEITGRSSAMIKLFGARVDLDRLDAQLAEEGLLTCSGGVDDRLVIAAQGCRHPGLVRALVCARLGVPGHVVDVHAVDDLPRLPSGKPDRAAVRALVVPDPQAVKADDDEKSQSDRAARLCAVYAEVLDRPRVTADDSYASLGADSLGYVALAVRLEAELGALPPDWPTRSIAELATQRRPRRWARLETSIVLRALAIVLIVGTHSELFTLRGGAHLLLAVAGFNAARFTPIGGRAGAHLRGTLRAVARIAIPSMVWIALVALVTGAYRPTTALLVNAVAGPDRWGPDWRFWFVEALVWTLLAVGLLLAIPAVRRWRARAPFGFALALVAVGLLPRFDVLTWSTGPQRGTAQNVFWLFALGWAATEAGTRSRRALLSVIVLLAVPGYFGQPVRDVIVTLGLLAAIWLPSMPVPRALVRPLATLAAASLAIYLTHWQVYPLVDGVPALATAASLAVGVTVWAGSEWLRARRRRHGATDDVAVRSLSSAGSSPGPTPDPDRSDQRPLVKEPAL